MLPAKPSFYYDDAVFRCHPLTRELEFGVIVDCGEMEDWGDDLEPGEVRVSWYPTGSDEKVRETELSLLDRSVSPGDFVRRGGSMGTCKRSISKGARAVGRVAGTRKVLPTIHPNRLVPLETFKVNQHVLYRGWVGIVEDVQSEMMLQTTDGRSSSMISAVDGASELHDLDEGRDHLPIYFPLAFYPGQQLWGPKSFLKTLPWIGDSPLLKTGNKHRDRESHMRVIVKEYVTTEISVLWFCSAKTKPQRQPSRVVYKDQFPHIRVVNELNLQPFNLGSFGLYSLREDDKFISLSEWREMLVAEYIQAHPSKSIAASESKPIPDSKASSKTPASAHSHISNLDITETEHPISTTASANDKSSGNKPLKATDDFNVDDLSMILRDIVTNPFRAQAYFDHADISVKEGILFGSSSKKNDYGFFLKPWKKKAPKFCYALGLSKSARLTAAIPSMVLERKNDKPKVLVVEILRNCTEMEVEWQNGDVERLSTSELYYIDQFDNLEFFPGDFVTENKSESKSDMYGIVLTADLKERTAKVNWFIKNPDAEDKPVSIKEKDEVSVYDIVDHSTFSFKVGSCVIYFPDAGIESDGSGNCGQVIDILPSGHLKIVLACGKTVLSYPQDVRFVFEHTNYTDGEVSEEENNEDSWESASIRSEEPYAHEILPNDTIDAFLKSLKRVMVNFNNFFDDEEAFRSIMAFLINLLKTLKPICGEFVEFLQSRDSERMAQDFLDPELHLIVQKCLQNVVQCLKLNRRSELKEQLRELYSLANITVNRSSLVSLTVEVNTSKLPSETSSEYVKMLSNPNLPLPEVKPDDCDGPTEPCGAPTEPTGTTIHSLPPLSNVDPNLFEEKLIILEFVPETHRFRNTSFKSQDQNAFSRTIKAEINLLKSSLPEGILVRGFEDRMDLFSCLLHGPRGTPYEDGLFLFDLYLPRNYPNAPPQVHYLSFCSDKLNPNLYEEGRVCISLLGTWTGEGSEVWNPENSNLLQLLVSIQGLILVAEPYFNEAGYDKQVGTDKGQENSRIYNETVMLNLIQSMTRMIIEPPDLFRTEILEHFRTRGIKMINRIEGWICPPDHPPEKSILPEFSLFPISKGFCLSITKLLQNFRQALFSIDDSTQPPRP